MKFFSKITFICNLGFLVFIVLGYIELNAKKASAEEGMLPLPFFMGTMVVLGQFALFLNLIFCLIAGRLLFFNKPNPVAPWLRVVNCLFLFIQVYYFLIC